MTEQLNNSNNYFGPGPSLSTVNIKQEGQRKENKAEKGVCPWGEATFQLSPSPELGSPHPDMFLQGRAWSCQSWQRAFRTPCAKDFWYFCIFLFVID